jgi:hypothetical protein
MEALPAAPDGIGLPAGAGIDHLIVGAVAVRAAHGKKQFSVFGFQFSVFGCD